jgi:hypothetical protein
MVKAKRLGFRAWFYLRVGYSTYWTFLLMGINTLTVTYYLAIENVPFLKEIFPSFIHYVVILVVIGVPTLIFTGYSHYKKIPGYKSEAEVNLESNPYQYKLPPGFWLHVLMPYFRVQSDLLLKLSENKTLSEEDQKKMEELQKKMDHLLSGGYVGDKEIIKKFESQD